MMDLKPHIGEQVDYFDPTLAMKAGLSHGYGNRKNGPYLAFVTNNQGAGLTLLLCLPETPPFSTQKGMKHKDDVQKNMSGEPTAPYWDWKDNLQKARAQKRADAEA